MVKKNSLFFCFTSFFFWGQIAFSWVFNNPYDEKPSENIGYKAFSSPPKTLDPAKSYSSNELLFVAQIYEAPLQFHYLKRPYSLAPRTTVGLPGLRYFNKKNKSFRSLLIFLK